MRTTGRRLVAGDGVELAVAARHEALAGHARNIDVVLHADGSCEVADDGRGMPVDIHPEEKIPGVELDESGNIISYNIETQCRSVFQNIKYILEDAGSSWDNIVDVQVFLTNMKDDFATYNRVYAEWFKDNQPCRTTIEINCLPTPIAIELKVIATI